MAATTRNFRVITRIYFMNRLVLALFFLSSGAFGEWLLHHGTVDSKATKALQYQRLQDVNERLKGLNVAATQARDEVVHKRIKVSEAANAPSFSPELLELLTGNALSNSPRRDSAAWRELRDRLGIDWNSSDEFVLVSKSVVSQFSFPHLYAVERPTDTADSVFALSPQEQSSISDILEQARQAMILRVQRNDPQGDEVAKYTIQSDPILLESISNQFSAQITAVLGTERSDLFLTRAWRELKSDLMPEGYKPVVMTIRQSRVGGEPKLTWELAQGSTITSGDVRYAYYPSSWFLTLFPGGWAPIAAREGFELPESFRN